MRISDWSSDVCSSDLLVRMKGIVWDEASQGTKFEYIDIPADLVDQANEWHEKLVESAAEANEELMNKYLETGELTEAEINLGLRTRTIAGEIQRSEEHTSELQSLMRISYAVFCLKKKNEKKTKTITQ